MSDNTYAQDIAKYIDLDTALSRVRGNKAIYKRMLNLFLASEEFSAFENALAENDNARAADIAHGIKGMTGNLGFNPLFEESTKLMLQLRDGDADPETLESYRNVLKATIECAKLVTEQD